MKDFIEQAYGEQKGFLSRIRVKINEFIKARKTIDRLMTDKVDDYILVEEQPLPILVGGKTIFVGNFNLYNENDFFFRWGKIIALMTGKILTLELSDDRRRELLEKGDFHLLADGKYMYEFLTISKWFNKQLLHLLKKTLFKQQKYYRVSFSTSKSEEVKIKNRCSFKYFKKHITKEKLIQILWLIYLYNFDAEKKNLKLIVEKMNMGQLLETYIPFWLQNLNGLMGKFLNAQVPEPDYVFNDMGKGRVSLKEVKKETPNG
jgi:hypothetical protein